MPDYGATFCRGRKPTKHLAAILLVAVVNNAGLSSGSTRLSAAE
jgi:hypothetical protein